MLTKICCKCNSSSQLDKFQSNLVENIRLETRWQPTCTISEVRRLTLGTMWTTGGVFWLVPKASASWPNKDSPKGHKNTVYNSSQRASESCQSNQKRWTACRMTQIQPSPQLRSQMRLKSTPNSPFRFRFTCLCLYFLSANHSWLETKTYETNPTSDL